jgi:hypothetical protein
MWGSSSGITESYTRHLTLERKQANSGRVTDLTERNIFWKEEKKSEKHDKFCSSMLDC